MQLRWSVIILGIYLSFTLLGCHSKPTGANGPSDSSSSKAPSTPDSSTASNGGAADNNSTAPPAPAPAQPAVVPAGTMLTVRLAQAVGSKISQAGQSFSAIVVNPVEADGQIVIPVGSAVSGTVVDAQPLGHFAGGARLQLKLTSVQVNGADQPVVTSSLVRVIRGKGKRTGIIAGGGAALGAIIGGIAGKGKGAAIGAAAGGGAGAAGGAATGNKEIVLPAESAISFKLTQPLEIK